MKSTGCILLGIFLSASVIFAEDNGNYLNYSIPVDAIKVGPQGMRDPEKQEYLYFAPGMARSRENLIAIDVIDHDILVKRELLKDRKKHGVQREWHLNGRPKVEAPYKNGIMEGVFRAFDDKGALVGQYAMLQGNGTVVIYDSSGRLTSEDQYKNNLRDGLRMERIANLISLTWSKNGHPIGKGYGFFENSGLAAITFFSNSGDPVGPVVEFSSAGSLTKKSWYLNNRIVTETEYAAVASKDPSLPPYYAEVRQYKQFVSEEVQALLTKYRTMPRVKIPLQ